MVFNVQFNKQRIIQLDTVCIFCVTNFSVRAPRKNKDQFHLYDLYMIRRSVLLYFFRSSLQLVSISAFEMYHLSRTHFSFLISVAGPAEVSPHLVFSFGPNLLVRTKLAKNLEKRQNPWKAICCCCFVRVLYLFQCFFLMEYAFGSGCAADLPFIT